MEKQKTDLEKRLLSNNEQLSEKEKEMQVRLYGYKITAVNPPTPPPPTPTLLYIKEGGGDI